MKKLFFLCLIVLFFSIRFNAQSFYNGSLENDTLSNCYTTLYNSQFNIRMPHVTAFGNYDNGANIPVGKTSIQDSGCSVNPVHGRWCVGLRGSFGPTSDAIAIELDAKLDSGTTYYVSFYCYGNLSFHNFDCDLTLGSSLNKYTFGTPIYSVTSNYLLWKNSSFTFTAIDTSQYITVQPVPGYHSWIQVDNFIISKNPIPLGLHDYASTDFFRLYPNPANTSLSLSFANDPEPRLLEVYNEYGQAVLPKQVIHEQVTNLDLTSLSTGFYTIRVTNATSSVCRKIIVAR